MGVVDGRERPVLAIHPQVQVPTSGNEKDSGEWKWAKTSACRSVNGRRLPALGTATDWSGEKYRRAVGGGQGNMAWNLLVYRSQITLPERGSERLIPQGDSRVPSAACRHRSYTRARSSRWQCSIRRPASSWPTITLPEMCPESGRYRPNQAFDQSRGDYRYRHFGPYHHCQRRFYEPKRARFDLRRVTGYP